MATTAPERISYGDDALQYGDLHRPDGDARPGTVVLVHGGFWRPQYGLDNLTPNADDLADRGWTVWNLEYRRVGQGAWPATLADVAAGVDHLRGIPDVDTGRVVVVGHSAGGHLAGWVAGRAASPPGTLGHAPAVPVHGAISLAGVLDLDRAARTGIGDHAAQNFVGGGPDEFPERYALADPSARLPTGVRIRCVHGTSDVHVPHEQSSRYVAAAVTAGDDVALDSVDGDHFVVVDTAGAAWKIVVDRITELLDS